MSDTPHDRIRAAVAEAREGASAKPIRTPWPTVQESCDHADRILDRHRPAGITSHPSTDFCQGCGLRVDDCPEIRDLAEAWGVNQ